MPCADNFSITGWTKVWEEREPKSRMSPVREHNP
jgi:hypothetical protein